MFFQPVDVILAQCIHESASIRIADNIDGCSQAVTEQSLFRACSFYFLEFDRDQLYP